MRVFKDKCEVQAVTDYFCSIQNFWFELEWDIIVMREAKIRNRQPFVTGDHS